MGIENIPGNDEAFRIKNDLFPFVDTDIWVDKRGKTIKESVRDGLVVTQAEDAASASRFLAQNALAKLGFDPGPIDAMIGMNTRVAIRAWQKARGLPADGYLSVEVLSRLRSEASGSPSVGAPQLTR